MSQRTRYFLIASFLVIAVGLGTGLVAYYNGGLRASEAVSDLSYVPAGASAVAYADVRSIMNSQLRQRLREMMPSGQDRDRLEAELGLDLERDIDSVIAGYTGTSGAEGGIVLARGRFDDDMIETKAVQHGAVAETYRGKRLIIMRDHAVNPGDLMPRDGTAPATVQAPLVPGIAVLEPGLLAFGDEATLRKAIDAAATKTDVTGNAEIMKQITALQGTGNAWVVTRFDTVSGNAAIPAEMKGQLPQLEWLAASANVNGGLTGTLRAEARDDKAATDLHAVITGGLAAVRMMSGQDKRLETLINSVQVMGAGKTVTVTFALQPELFDMISGVTGIGRSGGSPPR
jgi:hypothetical protein